MTTFLQNFRGIMRTQTDIDRRLKMRTRRNEQFTIRLNVDEFPTAFGDTVQVSIQYLQYQKQRLVDHYHKKYFECKMVASEEGGPDRLNSSCMGVLSRHTGNNYSICSRIYISNCFPQLLRMPTILIIILLNISRGCYTRILIEIRRNQYGRMSNESATRKKRYCVRTVKIAIVKRGSMFCTVMEALKGLP